MTYPTDQWPTMPVVWRHELPHKPAITDELRARVALANA